MSHDDPQQLSNFEDEIDLTAIFRELWHRRLLIVTGTLVVTLVAAMISFALPKVYRSEGFYQLGNKKEKKMGNKEEKMTIGIPIDLYKRWFSLFTDPDHFKQSITQENELNHEELKTMSLSSEEIGKWIRPVYNYAKEDARDFVQSRIDETNTVLALKLSYDAATPEKAYDFVNFLGKYIRDNLLYLAVYEHIMNNFSDINADLRRNENLIINLKYDISLGYKKILDIKKILTKYPETAKIDNQPTLPSDLKNGYQYFSPVIQIVGIESKLSDQHKDLNVLERERKLLLIRQEYFTSCKNELETMQKNGEILFLKMKSTQEKIFADKDMNNDEVKEVANGLDIDIQDFQSVFFDGYRFISGPTIPDRPIAPQKRNIVFITFFLSAVFFVSLSLLLAWVQRADSI